MTFKRAIELFRSDLAPCAEKVLAIDADPVAYAAISAEPLVLDRNVLTGRATAVGLRDAFVALEGL